MAHRIRIHRTGGSEVLRYEAFDVGEPGPGQVRLLQEAAGVNFVDTQFRDGIYPAKAAWLRERGIDTVLDAGDPDLAAKVVALTGGRGVDVVYELVGAATFEKSVAALRPGGDLVHFGNASGPPRIDPAALAVRAIAYTKPETADFVNSRSVLMEASADLWSALAAGILEPPSFTSYPLSEARRAHEDIRARSVVGSMVLAM